MHVKKCFLILYVVQPINNVVMVSGAQHSDSAIYLHVSILSQTPLPPRLLLAFCMSHVVQLLSK